MTDLPFLVPFLALRYLKLLEPSPKESITTPTFEEAAAFIDNCYGLSGGRKLRKIVKLTEDTLCGGEVAAVLSLLVTGQVSYTTPRGLYHTFVYVLLWS